MSRVGAGDRVRAVTFVLAGGLVAGTFDITHKWAFWALKAGVPAQRVFQSVAKGLLGPAGYKGGVGDCGVWSCFALFHCNIDVRCQFPCATALCLAPRATVALRRGMRTRALCGHELRGSRVVAHVFLIGVPIALFASRAIVIMRSGSKTLELEK